MIDYDSFSHCHLKDIFFAIHAGAKELSIFRHLTTESSKKCEKTSKHITVLRLQFLKILVKLAMFQKVTFHQVNGFHYSGYNVEHIHNSRA